MFNKKKERNLLELVPLLADHVELQTKEDGKGILNVQRSNWVERFSIRFLKQPAVRSIQLDEYGTYALSQMKDGATVADLAQRMSTHFGEDAEPVLPRLTKFIQILESQEWLIWKNE
ncbi:PqqD family protein [Bacillus sp. FJAT-42376]|uniref:PqqD family peptide modification chaperone n=1 Tax=Bacillus sp. FJAT-42376 TaxID=2014076 RepID=UPI000F506BD3|nr:PqqD family peptide modification chaperone [Bacillus sp. FJAT-42376]AZB41008.1 PqqD family protein [Bacillus sp. FJAT-42376]